MNSYHLTRKFAFAALCGLVAVGLTCGTALAHDLAPPDWRGLAWQYKTHDHWTFETDANPAAPEVDTDAFYGMGVPTGPGSPSATMDGLDPVSIDTMGSFPDYDGEIVWLRGAGTFQDPVTDPGSMDIFLPNWVDNEIKKLIRVQVTSVYFDVGGDNSRRPSVLPDSFQSDPSVISIESLGAGVVEELERESVELFPGAFVDVVIAHEYTDWIIRPNPDWESFSISVPPAAGVFQVVVDTISIPEPGTMTLAGLAVCGLVGAARRRRR